MPDAPQWMAIRGFPSGPRHFSEYPAALLDEPAVAPPAHLISNRIITVAARLAAVPPRRQFAGETSALASRGWNVLRSFEVDPNRLLTVGGNPFRRRTPVRLFTDDGFPIPHGFKSQDEFRAFSHELRDGLPEGVEPLFQGSSVTGRSATTGAVFDIGRVSDFDVGLVSPDLFQRAQTFGSRVKTVPVRIGPVKLDSKLARHLGLNDLLGSLSRRANRQVSFNLYPSFNDARSFPAIDVPGGNFGGGL